MLPHDPTTATTTLAREGTTRREDARLASAGSRPGAVALAARRGWLPDGVLVAHIVERHHAYARRALPYVVAMLAKVAACHRRDNPKLPALCDAGQELADLLETHLDEEEQDLFPALLADPAPSDGVGRETDRMCRHHRVLGLLLARVRWLADDFAVPAFAGRSYQVLMEELEALEDDVLEHVHLERFVLLPRLSPPCAEPC